MMRLRAAALAVMVLFALAGPARAEIDPQVQGIVAGSVLAGGYLACALVAAGCGLALVLLTVFLAPALTDRAADRAGRMPFRSFLAGVPICLLFVWFADRVKHHGLPPVVQVPLLLLFLGGTAAIAQDLGRRAWALADRSATRAGRLGVGWGVYLFASLIPILGWFLLGPILLATGTGGFLIELFTRAPGQKQTAES